MGVTPHITASELGWTTWNSHVSKLADAEFEKQLVEIEGRFTDVWDD